ncbi:hypothetical protein LTR10_023236 [Elasticomyces elasticus]|uniref:RING-type E3 ubiquitin transferase n=1 Tax=Exophiala sideris TaxID=1016849 RepID=A0ABR0JK55_9EURO|nr:hypothetical protein LTR10_023236 [Elasticomyces elasticus]KAK5035196.1 hypothetical protein LTS07_002632 [Exophiala sideris]KAK5039452.1 hypothetical protein LTR13_003709 [Exophiala sideris]KAK5066120.1 hypothetical protein LTR69_002638 [Exophiala sideris]KAK5186797.1 hypothetical protein LTR44_000803 [Eurotiomycetes sp. CCFEE 6388]
MRPLRFLLLLVFFIALPIALTCWSLLKSSESAADALQAGYDTRPRGLRALFSFSTPSSLFPPSAIISLTNDNSTFFLARPAAFGPSLPSKGLSGQLWVGKGFGDDALLKEENIHVVGWELGCSDVPGWADEASKRVQNLPQVNQGEKGVKGRRDLDHAATSIEASADGSDSSADGALPADDGTDDYLHRPLPDSNPATPAQPGEPANIDPADKNKKATHADIESLQESADIAGKIVMVSRGGCGFLEKVKWAQRRGGVALIVGDNERGGQLTIMYAKGDTSNVSIPAVFTSYTSAHLLSSLVPPDSGEDEDGPPKEPDRPSKGAPNHDKHANHKQQGNKPVFTPTKTGARQPTIVPAGETDETTGETWLGNVLSAIGLDENSPFGHAEDSRRPPSSGNIDWVLLEDWDEEAAPKSTNKASTAVNPATLSTSTLKAQSTKAKRPGEDDFVIGVQDWRDTDLVAPKAISSSTDVPANGKNVPLESASAIKGADGPEETLKGGSITPGSGEYDHVKSDHAHRNQRGKASSRQRPDHPASQHGKQSSEGSWFDLFKSSKSDKHAPKAAASKQEKHSGAEVKDHSAPAKEEEHPGLWVTLTPTSVSTSPFFDTLLVLVRSRPRSQTTNGVFSSSAGADPSLATSRSPPTSTEKPQSPAAPAKSTQPKRKRYTGRQVECVVCLEEYIDGESKVMSLPCGHEFHAECITPWLVTRRRTCPICKGDVVRSLARGEDETLENEQTSDDVQDRVAQTANEEPSAAIPIPTTQDSRRADEDVERGQAVDAPLLGEGEGDGEGRNIQRQQEGERLSVWRNISASVSRLSGDTLWRQTPVDRNR